MTRFRLPAIFSLSIVLLAAPALAGDFIRLKDSKWHINVPRSGLERPTVEDFAASTISVTSEDYDFVNFSLDMGQGGKIAQKIATDRVEEVIYEPPPAAYNDGVRAMTSGDLSTAMQKFTSVASSRSARSWTRMYSLFNLGQIYHSGADWEQAVTAWSTLRKEFPKSRFLPDAIVMEGLARFYSGDAEKARTTFGELDRISGLPEGKKALGRYWVIYVKQRQGEAARNTAIVNQALSEYRTLLASVENDESLKEVAILARLGIGTCLVGMKKFDEAQTFFQRIADSSNDPEVLAGAFNGLGLCYYEQQQWDPALIAFLRTTTIYDVNIEQTAKANFYVGKCFQLLQKEDWKSRARKHYRKAIAKAGGTEWAQRSREALPTIR
jgi:TolA-binding protein